MQLHPFVRILTFGPLEVVSREDPAAGESALRYVPLSTERLNGRGTTAAFTLLKVLMCQPHRHAPRDLLMELLWSEHTRRQAGARLDDAASVLRTLLRPGSGENLLEYRHSNRDTGNSYRLAPYPYIWVDADAFEWYVAQACRLERFGDDPLPLWEEAYHLASRGAFLADEVYSEWTIERRELLSGQYRQCVHEVTRLYRERGALAEAERVLREHHVREPMDEDALRPFMELLGEQERYQEASNAYRRVQEALAQEGRTPDPRTQEIAEYLRAKQITRTRASAARPTFSLQPQRAVLPHLRAPSVPGSTQALLRVGQTGSNARLAPPITQVSTLLGTDAPFDGTLNMLRLLLEGEEHQAMSLLSRRQLLALGIATFISRLAQLDSRRISAIEREELGRALGASIADGWKLFLSLENAQVVAMGRAQLSLIHQAHTLIDPSALPYFYAGAYGFLGLGLHFQERKEEALHMYHHGYIAALATGNPWYVAQSLICQADTHLALGRHTEALRTLEEALSCLGDTDEEHRRAKAHILACLADTAMERGAHAEAHKKLDEAAAYLDQTTVIEEFDRSTWLQLAGKKALMIGEYQQAIDHLEEALAANPPHWLVRQAGILTPLAMAYARIQEREQSLSIARQAIPVIGAVNAPMTNKYFLEYISKDLLGRFSRDREIHTFLAETQQQLPHLPAFVDAS